MRSIELSVFCIGLCASFFDRIFHFFDTMVVEVKIGTLNHFSSLLSLTYHAVSGVVCNHAGGEEA